MSQFRERESFWEMEHVAVTGFIITLQAYLKVVLEFLDWFELREDRDEAAQNAVERLQRLLQLPL